MRGLPLGARCEGDTLPRIIALLFALLFSVSWAPAETAGKTISPEEASNYHGQTVTVRGAISADTTSGRGNRFLNMGGTNPNQAFAGWIPTKNAGTFSTLPNVTGRTCSITGRVQPYKGKPEIVLSSPFERADPLIRAGPWPAAKPDAIAKPPRLNKTARPYFALIAAGFVLRLGIAALAVSRPVQR